MLMRDRHCNLFAANTQDWEYMSGISDVVPLARHLPRCTRCSGGALIASTAEVNTPRKEWSETLGAPHCRRGAAVAHREAPRRGRCFFHDVVSCSRLAPNSPQKTPPKPTIDFYIKQCVPSLAKMVFLEAGREWADAMVRIDTSSGVFRAERAPTNKATIDVRRNGPLSVDDPK